MVESSLISVVTAATFEEEVLTRSCQTPVLVDFWATWCQPCQVLMPLLSELVDAYQGKFHLAKVDTEAEQELAGRYQIRSLPTVMLFKDGDIVDRFHGAQPEGVIRQLLDSHLPRESDAQRSEASRLAAAGEFGQAKNLLERAAAEDPDNTRITFDLIALNLDRDELEEAKALLQGLPIALRQEQRSQALEARLRLHKQARGAASLNCEQLRQQIDNQPTDLDTRALLAAKLVLSGHLDGALEQYLEIMRRDRRYSDEAGRKGLLEVFKLMDDGDPRVSEYRRKMTALMY